MSDPAARMSPLCIVFMAVLSILLLISFLSLGAGMTQIAAQGASLQALAECHSSFVRRHGLSQEYLEEIRKCQEMNPGIQPLLTYRNAIDHDLRESSDRKGVP